MAVVALPDFQSKYLTHVLGLISFNPEFPSFFFSLVVQHLKGLECNPPDIYEVLLFEATFVCLCKIHVNITVSAVG